MSTCFHSFLEESEDTKKTYWNSLTFRKDQKCHPLMSNRPTSSFSVWVIYIAMPNSINKLCTQRNPVMKTELPCKCCWTSHVTKSWNLHNQPYPATCLALLCHYKRSRHLILICAVSMGLVYQTGQKTKDGGSNQQAACCYWRRPIMGF